MPHIAVIGAGITGITSAYALLDKGFDVTVIERLPYAAMETSYANGGQLSASNAEVWNSVATIRKGVRWLLRPDAPLLINPSPSLHKYGWLAEFCANIRGYSANTIETTRLAIEARRFLFAVAEREGIDFDLQQKGMLHFYHSKAEFESAARANALLQAGGLDRYAVTPAEMSQIEPTLQGDFFGGFFTPSDASGDIHKFTRGLAEACSRRGATLRFRTEISGIAPGHPRHILALRDADTHEILPPLEADAILVCAGVASRRLAAELGDRVNIYPVKGYSITVNLSRIEDKQNAPTVCLLDDAAKIVTSRLGADRFRVAGTAEFNGFNRDIRADRTAPLVNWVRRHFPSIMTDHCTPWAGLRPMTPGMMPRVGRGRRDRVYYNTGHGHLGWTLSAVTAELIAQKIETDQLA